MVIFKHVKDVKEYIAMQKKAARTVGFVPTMGALHEGHISLIDTAKAESSLVICSIFVNPTQFNDKEDFEKYPVSTEQDIEMLVNAGCDVLFLPSVAEMYPGGTDKIKEYDFGYLETVLEGAQRPGHFRGVGQVVGRLLEIVEPEYLYLGQKDFQQCMVITRLAELTGLRDLKVVICPTMREADGLAMSSRNRRLTDPQRAIAAIIYQCLVSIESKQGNTPFNVVRKECEDLMTAKGFVVEYVTLADATNLKLLDNYKKDTPMVALIAAKIGEIRLIDNLLVGSRES
ncbi:MAG: pantoate--beta-alanine ligase [Flavipsychrobacter sp.]|jgi:pantoate--beta-alanine ligase|nr:pantoate--beta-alanine ligase [Flavipsychrobacter sp.]